MTTSALDRYALLGKTGLRSARLEEIGRPEPHPPYLFFQPEMRRVFGRADVRAEQPRYRPRS